MIVNQDFSDIPSCHFFVAMHPDVSTTEEILRHLAQYLVKEGCVKTSYADAVLKREFEYPTGLKLNGLYNVALAHAGSEYVNENAIIVGVLDQPIDFHLMEDPDCTISVHIVFMFSAINFDSINYFVRKLTEEVLLKSEIVDQIPNFQQEEQVYSFLKPILFGFIE